MQISDFSKKIIDDIDHLKKIIIENENNPGEINLNDKIIDHVENLSLASSALKVKRAVNSLSTDIMQKIDESNDSFSDLINDSQLNILKTNRSESIFDKLTELNKSILFEASQIRATDHIIYNEMFEDSIRNKKVYEGQLSATKCAFGKWFTRYKPQSEKERKAYGEIALAHDQIHQYQTESVEFMKQNRFDAAEKIFKDKIKPSTENFIRKLSDLLEGIIIVGTGFRYITSLFEKTNSKIHELSTPFGKISKVVNIIDTIRIKTNMLAVCGTIEAARAGEYGKGFAFVGGDIKNLASETKDNNEKIKDLLDMIYELLDKAKKDFSEVNLLIITQDQEAIVSINSLTQIEKKITQTNSIDESLKDAEEKLTLKMDKYKITADTIKGLYDKIDLALKEKDNLFKSFTTKIDELQRKFEEFEMNLLTEA
jgi:hypothetical protein